MRCPRCADWSRRTSLVTTDTDRFPSEAKLVLHCVRTELVGADPDRLHAVLDQELNDDRVVDMTQRHGVVPLLSSALTDLDAPEANEELVERLTTEHERIAKRNLHLTNQLRELLDLFDDHGISAFPYKGPVLAEHLYGDVSRRQFRDLDLLVPREDVREAKTLLESRGYRPEHDLSPAQEAAMLRSGHHYALSHPRTEVQVELHWRLTPTSIRGALDLETLRASGDNVALAGRPVPVPSPEVLLLVLAVHGTKHRWKRLKWLCDVSALLHTREIDWHATLDRARALGHRRAVLLAVVLANDLLDATLPAEIRTRARRDSTIEDLATVVRTTLFDASAEFPSEWDLVPFRVRAQERLSDRLQSYVYTFLLPGVTDFEAKGFPDALFALYYLYRPLRLIKQFCLRAECRS